MFIIHYMPWATERSFFDAVLFWIYFHRSALALILYFDNWNYLIGYCSALCSYGATNEWKKQAATHMVENTFFSVCRLLCIDRQCKLTCCLWQMKRWDGSAMNFISLCFSHRTKYSIENHFSSYFLCEIYKLTWGVCMYFFHMKHAICLKPSSRSFQFSCVLICTKYYSKV